MTDLCKHCGKPASEHHQFELRPRRPDNCVCHDGWPHNRGIAPICDNFLEGINKKLPSWCNRCGHDAGCHTGVKG